MDARAEHLIRTLGLAPHPEGGYYREIWRSPLTVEPADGRGRRAASTVIHFLLPSGDVSRWHRVRSDEIFQYCEGAPFELLHLPPGSWNLQRTHIGPETSFSRCIPAGWWQASRSSGSYTLVTCIVAPGFEFADFEILGDHAELAAELHRACPEAVPFV
jgi:predicted cupin superfamily sugar epimerase